jgi:hypothetical protein
MSKVAQLQTSDNDTRAMISDWCGEMNTEMIRIKNQMGDVRDGFIRFLSALSKETATEVVRIMNTSLINLY